MACLVVVVKTNAFAKMFSSGMQTVSDIMCQRRPPFKVDPKLTFSKPGTN